MPSSRPNLLWWIASQWRAQTCPEEGEFQVRAPGQARLHREGIRCPRCISNHPFPPYAKAALLTGNLSPGNGLADPLGGLPPHTPTLAHHLRRLGYATAHFGKWQLYRRAGDIAPVNDRDAQTVVPPDWRGGFDHWEGFEAGFRLWDPWLHGSDLPQPRLFPGYQADVLGERARRWILQAREPWFCVVHVDPPHPPYDAAVPEGVPRLPPQAVHLRPNVPRGGEAEARARRELSGYYAHIEACSLSLNRLLDCLSAQGRIQRTLTAAFSNHGDMHGSHGLFRKGWPHSESLRVPLALSCPGLLPAGTVWPGLISTIDLAQTCCGLLGLEQPRGEGQDLSPAILSGGPGRTQVPISLPQPPPWPLQCDRAWSGQVCGDEIQTDGPWGTLPLD